MWTGSPTAWRNDEPTLVDDALGALSWLVQPDQAEELVELAFRAATDPITTLDRRRGRRQRPSEPRRPPPESRADQPRSPPSSFSRRKPTRKSLARAHAYLLGMWGQTPRLEDLPAQAAARGASPEWLTSFRWWLDLPAWARPHPLPADGQASSCARLVAGRPVSDSMSPETVSSSPARMAV